MPSPIHVLAVAGARPNFMKIAPLMRELGTRPGCRPFLVHTGQHYDAAMSDSFFRDLGIPEPDANLGVGSGSHAEQTGHVLIKIEALLLEQRPDVVLVVGDVNSTLAATLAAVKLNIPVAHVEAGLRSGDREMPEEINRILTDAVSTWLFTTEEAGSQNLLREGVAPERIHCVGNVMIDTVLANLERARELDTLPRLGLEAGGYALLTLHRPSNVDDPAKLRALFDALETIHSDLPVVFPVHPRTTAAIEERLGGVRPALHLLEPQGYLDFLQLMAHSKLVLTDSGGIQEETTALGVPCLTLRENTERPITVSDGTNTIVGGDPETILHEARCVLEGHGKIGRTPPLWDGHAAERIVDVLERELWGWRMSEEQLALSDGTGLESRRTISYLTFGLVCLTLVVYWPILRAMVEHWQFDPDYSHGFLVVPLAIYFAYEKKYELQAAEIEGSWWGIVPLGIGLGLLAIGQLGSLLTPLRAGFVFTLMGLVLLLLGVQIFRILLFPMAFLLLMVPLPKTLVNIVAFPLQLIAAEWAVWSLQQLGIPVLLEGNIIHLAKGSLFVAEACSGLRSLMALLTLGVVFAHFFRRGQRVQQVILVASTIPIAIVVNAMRVALTGFLAHAYGQEVAGGFIHEFQGMITFSVAFLLLLGEAKLLERFTTRSQGVAA